MLNSINDTRWLNDEPLTRESLRWLGLCAIAVLIGGCGSSQPVSSRVAAESTAPVTKRPADTCAALPQALTKAESVELNRLQAAVADGSADSHRTFERRFELVSRAADSGDRHAQYQAGSMNFGALFSTQAPETSERKPYVRAITWLILAAMRGDSSARGYMPGFGDVVDGGFPSAPEVPLTEIPREWIEAAQATASAWIRCYPDPS